MPRFSLSFERVPNSHAQFPVSCALEKNCGHMSMSCGVISADSEMVVVLCDAFSTCVTTEVHCCDVCVHSWSSSASLRKREKPRVVEKGWRHGMPGCEGWQLIVAETYRLNHVNQLLPVAQHNVVLEMHGQCRRRSFVWDRRGWGLLSATSPLERISALCTPSLRLVLAGHTPTLRERPWKTSRTYRSHTESSIRTAISCGPKRESLLDFHVLRD